MTVLRLMLSRKWMITTLFVIVGAVVCVGLGFWQLDRLAQKRASNAHYLAAIALPALTILSTPDDDLTSMEYRAVIVSGTYDFEHQVALRNQFYNNQPGYHLLTPLVLSDGTGILVERGWIPAEGNDQPSGWRTYDQPGVQTVRGILRLEQTESEIGGVSDPALAPGQTRLEVWNQINVARIAQQLPYKLLPVFVQPNPDPSLTQPPYPYQPTVSVDEGPHFGYAMQWFAFAALLFFGYPLFYLPRQVKVEKK
jgi:surfeit locus 1 family protein